MYARVARFEGGDEESMRRSAAEINAADGPPEGVPGKGFLLLIDPDKGQSLGIGLFETEEDLRKGDETLNKMNPPSDAPGRRVSVEMYEVAVNVTAPD
jgi:hypothetical protein